MQPFADCKPKFVNSLLCFQQASSELKHDGVRQQTRVSEQICTTCTVYRHDVKLFYTGWPLTFHVKDVGQQDTKLNI
jgi:hypothetical protein